MKSDAWFLFVLRSLGPVRSFRVERRTVILLAAGGIFLAAILAFLAYQYFTLLPEKIRLRSEIGQLKSQVLLLQQRITHLSVGIPPIAIDGLQVIRDPKRGGFSVRFWMAQQGAPEPPLAGTLAIVAKNETPRETVYRVKPEEMPLEKGIPKKPERGKPFEVKDPKFVEVIFDNPSGEVFQTLTIYIYSKGGKLILKRSAAIPKL